MPGAPSAFILATPDRETARRFYGTLLGLNIPDSTVPDPAGIATETIPGLAHHTDQVAGFSMYFGVADVEQAALLVKRLGGQVLSVTSPDTRFGRFAHCRDNQGAPFGLHEGPALPSDALERTGFRT